MCTILKMFRTPSKEERVARAKADDPPGTPATALLSTRSGYTSSTGRTPAERSDRVDDDSPDRIIPSAFNQAFSSPPRPVKPRTARNLFPQHSEEEKPVLVIDIEAGSSGDDTRETTTLGDSSSEQHAVISPARISKRISYSKGGVDIFSDPGSSGVDVARASTRIRRPASDIAGPTKAIVDHRRDRSDALFPQSPDEHRARIKAIMNKREEKQKRKKKTRKRCNTDGSDISGASADTYESIKEGGNSPYAGYLRSASYDDDDERLINVKKKSSTKSLGSPSKVSERWSKVEIEKVYARPVGDNNLSNINHERKKRQVGGDGTPASLVSRSSSGAKTSTSSKAASRQVEKGPARTHTAKPIGSDIPSMVSSSKNKSDVPRSAEEHKARLKEIMNKREMKGKSAKIGDDASNISAKSNRVSETSNISAKSSRVSEISSGVSGVSSNGSSKVSRSTIRSIDGSKGKLSKKVPDDKSSNVSDRSSQVSGASSTNSSIFAASRAKLKSYLTSYSRKKRSRKDKKSSPTTSNEKPPLAPSREVTPDIPANNDKEKSDILLTIVREKEQLQSFPEIIISNIPDAPHSPSVSRSGDKVLESPPLDLSPLQISPLSQEENTTSVINLPWWMDRDGDQIGEEQIGGLYSGPINEFLQPHGRGEILVKGTSSQTFHGTWRNGKLITPLTDLSADILSGPSTDDEGPMTEDEHSNSSSEEPLRGTSILQAASTKYAINKNLTINAAIAAGSGRVVKRPRKPKPVVRYNIGDACRSPKDMIICSSKEEATKSASQLKKWDGAFIKRSCGVWTYAILIERSPQPINVLKKRLEYFYWATVWEVDPRDEVEDSMLFAIDGDGSTKIIPEHIWAKYVRRVEPNPIPNVRRSDQEKQETAALGKPPSSDDRRPKTRLESPPVEATSGMPVTEMLKKRANQKGRKSGDEIGLEKCIESYFEAEFGKDSDDSDRESLGSENGPLYALKRTISSATEHLMNIVDSERGSSSPQVYENMSDTETERGSSEGFINNEKTEVG